MAAVHFKMEFRAENDWFVKIDLKDAYLTVAMYTDSQSYLQLTRRGKEYYLVALLQGSAKCGPRANQLVAGRVYVRPAGYLITEFA